MKIAIIGTGNVGGALATAWSKAGHTVYLGVQDINNFKGKELLQNASTSVHIVAQAVELAEIILIATPAMAAIEVAQSLGDTTGKIIIDSMNIIMGRGPAGFNNTSSAILANTACTDIVKCFNTTGYNNMANPVYNDQPIDMFMAGESIKAKQAARQLALDAGFAECYDMGGNDMFALMEQFAMVWINLAMFRGLGRNIAFKLLHR